MWADAGISQCWWPGLADPLNDTSAAQEPSSRPMAGHLYSFCPSTQKATGVPESSRATLPVLLHSSLYNQSPALPSSCQSAMVADLLEVGQLANSELTCSVTHLSCWAVPDAAEEVGLPPHPFQLPVMAISPTAQQHLQRPSVSKSQTLPPTTFSGKEINRDQYQEGKVAPPPAKSSSFQM